MFVSENEHLKSFLAFCATNNLVQHLKAKAWEKFAKGYNGPGYAQNKYHEKLASAYQEYKRLHEKE